MANGADRGDGVIDASDPAADDGHMTRRRIVIVGYPRVQSLDVVGPFEVFAGASKMVAASHAGPGYDISLVTTSGGYCRTESGLAFETEPLPDDPGGIDTLIVPGGDGVHDARTDAALVEFVRRAGSDARRLATVCSGAFLAAEAGLLDGRRVTTHWARARRLAAEFPSLIVDADPIYIQEGRVWTSAGVTAGIDLALALVEADQGPEVAQTAARWLVMFLRRPGGQTQFAAPVWIPRAATPTVRQAQELIDASPGADHRVPILAGAVAMSPRHFTRLFTAEVGESPGRYVERVRVEAARRRLEETGETVDVVAARCGFGTAETLRRTFHRRLGVAPDDYRRRFRITPSPDNPISR